MKVIDARNKYVLIIPDTHAPYSHKKALVFLRDIKDRFLPEDAIALHLGDEVDNHAISFHQQDQDLYSAGDELKKAIEWLHKLQHIFPKLYLCDSNHGSLAVRKFKSEGIPLRYMKTLQEIYGTPKWEWHNSYVLKTNSGNIFVCHGKASGYGILSKEMSMSCIQGHYHSKFEVTWHLSPSTRRFNCFSGCLIDQDSLAFHYGKNHIQRPALGVTIIDPQGIPHQIALGKLSDSCLFLA